MMGLDSRQGFSRGLGSPIIAAPGHRRASRPCIIIAQTLLERTGAVLTFENDKAGGAAVTIYWRNDRMKPLTT